jgi:hypothetical protein
MVIKGRCVEEVSNVEQIFTKKKVEIIKEQIDNIVGTNCIFCRCLD